MPSSAWKSNARASTCGRPAAMVALPRFPVLSTAAAPPEIYTLSLHVALPIFGRALQLPQRRLGGARRREHPRGPLDVAVPGALGRAGEPRGDRAAEGRG